MKEGQIKVKVGPGMFSSERSVVLNVGEKCYNLIVDKQDVKSSMLTVYVVADTGDRGLIVDLPRETFTGESRIRIPRTALV